MSVYCREFNSIYDKDLCGPGSIANSKNWVSSTPFALHAYTPFCAESHGLRLWADENSENGLRGTAVFAAYDPWDTCLRVVPNSFKYFRAAEKQGIVNFRDSLIISRALLDCCVHLRSQYRGHFAYFFDLPEVKAFFDCFHDQQALLDTENTRGACSDTFYETVPWPVKPRHHLISRTLDQIIFKPDDTNEPFTAVTTAIDFASWGPWIGLNVNDLCKVFARLKSPGGAASHPSVSVAGRRMIIPFFSQGFQGIVVGFFTGIDDKQSELVRTELLQFGQTLADRWSLQRFRSYGDTVQRRQDADHIAQAVLQLVSPVSYVIVEAGGRLDGYKLKEEESYWAGYRKLASNEISVLKSRNCEIQMTDTVVPGSNIRVKVLSDYNVLDQEFTRERIKMLLNNPFVKQAPVELESFSMGKLQHKKTLLEMRTENGPVSLAVRRQIFVVEKIIANYHVGSVVITNNDLFRYLKDKSDNVPSGYQISSHSDEISRFLGSSATVERSRNGVHIRWTPE